MDVGDFWFVGVLVCVGVLVVASEDCACPSLCNNFFFNFVLKGVSA